MAKLGERMKLYRTIRGYSMGYFARYLGVSVSTLRRYENLETEPDAEVTARFSKLMNISMDDLLGCTEAEFVNLVPDGIILDEDEIKRLENSIFE